MPGEARIAEAEIEILELRLSALEEILKPFTSDSKSPKPYVNFEYVKEEIVGLSQRSEELHNLCHDKARYLISSSRQILKRTIALKTLFFGIKLPTNPEDKIATLTAKNQELFVKVEVLEKADQARESGMK